MYTDSIGCTKPCEETVVCVRIRVARLEMMDFIRGRLVAFSNRGCATTEDNAGEEDDDDADADGNRDDEDVTTMAFLTAAAATAFAVATAADTGSGGDMRVTEQASSDGREACLMTPGRCSVWPCLPRMCRARSVVVRNLRLAHRPHRYVRCVDNLDAGVDVRGVIVAVAVLDMGMTSGRTLRYVSCLKCVKR